MTAVCVVVHNLHQVQTSEITHITDNQKATVSCQATSQISNDEFRRLAPYHRANNNRLVHRPAAKRGRNYSWRQTRFKPQDTWTQDFFCLANPLQNSSPTKTEKSKVGMIQTIRQILT